MYDERKNNPGEAVFFILNLNSSINLPPLLGYYQCDWHFEVILSTKAYRQSRTYALHLHPIANTEGHFSDRPALSQYCRANIERPKWLSVCCKICKRCDATVQRTQNQWQDRTTLYCFDMSLVKLVYYYQRWKSSSWFWGHKGDKFVQMLRKL